MNTVTVRWREVTITSLREWSLNAKEYGSTAKTTVQELDVFLLHCRQLKAGGIADMENEDSIIIQKELGSLVEQKNRNATEFNSMKS